METPNMADTFLQVDLIVPEDRAHNFIDRCAAFHHDGGFGRILGQKREEQQRYELALALQSTSAFPYTEFVRHSGTADQTSPFDADFFRDGPLAKANRVFRFVHLWRIRNKADLNLVSLMQKCGEDREYI